jgi:hypothetical protein
MYNRRQIQIESWHRTPYAACDYCPGEYWPDNKSGNHTMIIFATEQPLPDILAKLKKLVEDNVYV